MRALLACIAFLFALPAAQAQDRAPVRVIEITRENAEASANLIKSPQIGMPPIGRVTRQAEAAPPPAGRRQSWKDARADALAPAAEPSPPRTRSLGRVDIWRSTPSGRFIVRSYVVPAGDAMSGGD